MENWGCITFYDKVLLTPETNSTNELIQRNARSVAHEVAHMWFGNLVTPKWWDDIWLNEGFARFAEHHILAELRPEYRTWDKYDMQVFAMAIMVDSRPTTHAVQLEVPSADKLMDIFDTISYAKGSVCCRMLASFTADKFYECLKQYMDKFKWSNASSMDLLSVCDEVVGKRFSMLPSEFLTPWLKQPGFPRLEISMEQADDGQYIYKFTQVPVLKGVADAQDFVWPILVNSIS